MKTFSSLNGALALTALAWISELWRAFIDATQGFHMGAAARVTLQWIEDDLTNLQHVIGPFDFLVDWGVYDSGLPQPPN